MNTKNMIAANFNNQTMCFDVKTNNFFPILLMNDTLLIETCFDVSSLVNNQIIIVYNVLPQTINIYCYRDYNGLYTGYIPNTNIEIELNENNVLIGVVKSLNRNISNFSLCNN
jgi:hypothetical protein